MHGWRLEIAACLCWTMALGCTAQSAALKEPSRTSSAVAVTAPQSIAAPVPELPLDDPKTCFDPSAEQVVAEQEGWERDTPEHKAIAIELERRIVERSPEIVACQPNQRRTEEVDVGLEIGADGTTTSAKVFGTSLADCSVITCIRDKLQELQVAQREAGRGVVFRRVLAIAPQRVVRVQTGVSFLGNSPDSSAPCLAEPRAGQGRLAPEVIRRVVREQYGRFQKCYNAGLVRHSKLAGRVTMRFAIATDGKVSNVRIADTDVPDCTVTKCILDAFSHIEFPAPEGGTVTVQYPIMLQPG